MKKTNKNRMRFYMRCTKQTQIEWGFIWGVKNKQKQNAVFNDVYKTNKNRMRFYIRCTKQTKIEWGFMWVVKYRMVCCLFLRLSVFNTTFNNITAISWRSVLLVEETRENHWPVASRIQTLSHNVVSSTHRHKWGSN